MRLAALAGLALAGVAVGLVAERQAYEWTELSSWLPDLLAGWTLIGLGIALLALRRPAGAAALLLLAGFTWYAFNYDSTGPGATERLAEQAAYLHRAPILALALALPNGRRALVIGARTHYYEGHGVRRVVHSVRTAAAAGATTMILTNGAGGIRETWSAGTPRSASE